jgi:hypothetical protein
MPLKLIASETGAAAAALRKTSFERNPVRHPLHFTCSLSARFLKIKFNLISLEEEKETFQKHREQRKCDDVDDYDTNNNLLKFITYSIISSHLSISPSHESILY